jgi:hypothetical protein
MNYRQWLRSLHRNPWHPYPPKRIMLRRIGRWIRRFEKKHGVRSEFRNPEIAKRF